MTSLLILLACTPDYELDDDGDGVSELDGDCDDTNPDLTDETVFYADGDGDGFGNPDLAVTACGQPEGFVTDASDCDDGDAAVNPDAQEVCGGVDDDCDGLVDLDDDSIDASTEVAWYPDADGDGFGLDADPVMACEAPADRVTDNTDCNDNDANISPADAEICDGQDIDEDCDGVADDADDSTHPGTMTDWYTDADGDGFGDASTFIRQCEAPDATAVQDGTDCDDGDVTTWPGAPETCDDGLVNDCDGNEEDAYAECAWADTVYFTEADFTMTVGESDAFTHDMRVADVTGDGQDDLIIASAWSSATDGRGALYVLTDPLNASSTDEDIVIEGDPEGSSEFFASGMAVGDINGDGIGDILVGAPGRVTVEDDEGTAYLLLGPVTSGAAIDDAALIIEGSIDDAELGAGVGFTADMDGDGDGDLLVGAPKDDTGASNGGRIYLFSSSDTGTVNEDDALGSITHTASWTVLGAESAMTGAHDLNGDGVADIAVAPPWEEETYVFLSGIDGDVETSDADLVIDGADSIGMAIEAGFDWDGDGHDDLALGGPSGEGGVYIVAGPIEASTDVSTDALVSLVGVDNEVVGGNIRFTDINVDGQIDLVTTSGYEVMYASSATSNDGSGDAWVLYGGDVTGSHTVDEADITIVGGESFGATLAVIEGDTPTLFIGDDEYDQAVIYGFVAPTF